ncbi:Chitin binding Peritrophin-A domain [Homalodisca vitripennis]|nr:Chitin binding Peritrophin-A domain [Homalodisca vitripennis]
MFWVLRIASEAVYPECVKPYIKTCLKVVCLNDDCLHQTMVPHTLIVHVKGKLCLRYIVLCQRPGGRKPGAKPATPRPQPSPQPQEGDELTDECPEPNGYFADGYQCDKYYECIEGAITEKLCPDGMVFNDYSTMVEKCDLPFNIDCSTRAELQKPKPSLHCPRQNGYFAHEDSKICDKFYFCVDGKFNMITCPDGLVYNERTGICTWPDEAKKAGCSSQGKWLVELLLLTQATIVV